MCSSHCALSATFFGMLYWWYALRKPSPYVSSSSILSMLALRHNFRITSRLSTSHALQSESFACPCFPPFIAGRCP